MDSRSTEGRTCKGPEEGKRGDRASGSDQKASHNILELPGKKKTHAYWGKSPRESPRASKEEGNKRVRKKGERIGAS